MSKKTIHQINLEHLAKEIKKFVEIFQCLYSDNKKTVKWGTQTIIGPQILNLIPENIF